MVDINTELSMLECDVHAEVDAYQTEDMKRSFESAPSKDDLIAQIHAKTAKTKEKIDAALERMEQTLIKNIPETEEERRAYAEHIILPWERAVDVFTNLILETLIKIADFFVNLWNTVEKAFVWVKEKVVVIVNTVKGSVTSAFDYFRGLFCLYSLP